MSKDVKDILPNIPGENPFSDLMGLTESATPQKATKFLQSMRCFLMLVVSQEQTMKHIF